MPKYIVNEEMLREWASYGGKEDSGAAFDVEAEIDRHKREPDGSRSHYSPAQCPIGEEKLHERSRLVLAELRGIGILQLIIDYDGGGDEDFTYFRVAKLTHGERTFDALVNALQSGPVGDAIAIQAQPNPRYHSYQPVERSRAEWAFYRIEFLLGDLACQLLGRGFGTGEGRLVGSFVADLQANTLTDIAPEEAPSAWSVDYKEQRTDIDEGQFFENDGDGEQDAEFNAGEWSDNELQTNESLEKYEPAQISFDAAQLRLTARLALEQLQLIGGTQISMRYETGDPDSFVFFKNAMTTSGTITFEELITHLEEGPLGERLEIPSHYRSQESQSSVTRRQWAQENFNFFIHHLFWQLLGSFTAKRGSQFALEGSFTVDLESNTITDLAPEDY